MPVPVDVCWLNDTPSRTRAVQDKHNTTPDGRREAVRRNATRYLHPV